MNLADKIPVANWPTESGKYKVVQLDIRGLPHLRFAEERYETHGAILMMLLNAFDEEDMTYMGRSGFRLPEPIGKEYEVKGMGMAEIDVDNKKASFYGDSFDYEIGINKEHLTSFSSLVPD